MKWFLMIMLLTVHPVFALNKSRKIITANDEVSEVKTALGIATKILLPENPNAAPIIGDLGAFRIELIDKGYAIKPLRYGAKTNLFISTVTRPYTVKLVLVNQDTADYIVYLSSKDVKSEIVLWRDFKRKAKSEYFTIEFKRIGKTKEGYIILEFNLKSKVKQDIEPDWFSVRQGKSRKIINSLILSSREIDTDKPVNGAINLNVQDLDKELPLVFELKYQDGLKLEIPKEFLWRK